MHRLTISLNEISYGQPPCGLVALSFMRFCCVARFGPSVARASLVVARRVRRTEGGKQGIRICGRIVNIEFSVTFDVSIWFLARSGKPESMKAGNLMLVFDDGG